MKDSRDFFKLSAPFSPGGDQGQAIDKLCQGFLDGSKFQTLMGITGSGKTYTVACMIQELQRPALVITHNKTLAAQLYSEFKEFFPENGVGYFVSYYDYYQPEAYMPATDTYIEKDSAINDSIDRLRHEATAWLLSRRDIIVVASVSCIYGLGSPERYLKSNIPLRLGDRINTRDFFLRLANLQYERGMDLVPGTFRARGDTIEIMQASSETGIRIELFDDEIERIRQIHPLTGATIADLDKAVLFPATHFVVDAKDMSKAIKSIEEELVLRLDELKKDGKLLEAQRLQSRTRYDLDMLKEIGYCQGIENYSRHFDGRISGQPPYTLMDFFPEDYLLIIDESHMTIPQLHGMCRGDRARKQSLVEHGFRLPSAFDNRPLEFAEFLERTGQGLFVSATPGNWELEQSADRVIEQIIRPTGLLDPLILIRPCEGQVDDLMGEIRKVIQKKGRVLVTALTKKMAEELSSWLIENGIKARYMHSDVDTLERIKIIRDLRLGDFTVLVGINLLREGLDLPEVMLVGVLDADKEGFLRSATALIQTIGRAARNAEGRVILYGDKMTNSMKIAVELTNYRRAAQMQFNEENNIIPTTIIKDIRDLIVPDDENQPINPASIALASTIPPAEVEQVVQDLQRQMKKAVKDLDFERAALLRDEIRALGWDPNWKN